MQEKTKNKTGLKPTYWGRAALAVAAFVLAMALGLYWHVIGEIAEDALPNASCGQPYELPNGGMISLLAKEGGTRGSWTNTQTTVVPWNNGTFTIGGIEAFEVRDCLPEVIRMIPRNVCSTERARVSHADNGLVSHIAVCNEWAAELAETGFFISVEVSSFACGTLIHPLVLTESGKDASESFDIYVDDIARDYRFSPPSDSTGTWLWEAGQYEVRAYEKLVGDDTDIEESNVITLNVTSPCTETPMPTQMCAPMQNGVALPPNVPLFRDSFDRIHYGYCGQ